MALELEPAQWAAADNVFEEATVSPSYCAPRTHLGSSNLEVFIEEEHIDGGGVLTVSAATASSGSATSPDQVSSVNGSVNMRRGNSKSATNLGLSGDPSSEFFFDKMCVFVSASS